MEDSNNIVLHMELGWRRLFLEHHKIMVQLSVCVNKTFNDRAKIMRLNVGLPKNFQADAVNIATYLINQIPLIPLEFKIPKDVWSDKQVKKFHLKVFCCVSFVHINFDACSKLDTKCKIYVYIYIGYGDENFGYQFWNEQNRKITKSKNVIFSKHVMHKERLTTVPYMIDQKKSEFVNLDELNKIIIYKRGEKYKFTGRSQYTYSYCSYIFQDTSIALFTIFELYHVD